MFGVLLSLLGSFSAGGIDHAVKRTKTQAIVLGFTAFLGIIAVLFFCVFIYLALSCFLPPLWASASLFMLFFVLTMLVYFIGQAMAKKQKKALEKKTHEQQKSLLVSSALAAIPAALAGDKKVAMIALPLIGLAALWFYKNNIDKNDNKPK